MHELQDVLIADRWAREETAKLVSLRGELMQDACDQNPGTMAALIGLDEKAVYEISRQT